MVGPNHEAPAPLVVTTAEAGPTNETRDTRSRAVRKPDWWIVLAAFVFAAATCLTGEKIDVCDGLGWDGCNYGAVAINPRAELFEKGRDAARIRRIMPGIVAHLVLSQTTSNIEPGDVVQFFIYANVLGIILACGLVVRTLDALGAGSRTKCVAALALLLNFGVAKWMAWYPVLTDMPGLVLGAGLLYAYVRRWRWLLYVLTFLAGFTWYAAYFQGLILTIWEPFRTDARPDSHAGVARSWTASVLAGALALGFVAYSLYLISPEQFPTIRFLAHLPMWEVMPLSVGIAAAYIFLGGWMMLRAALPGIQRFAFRVVVHPNTWLALLVLVAGVQAIVLQLAARSSNLEDVVLRNMVVNAIDRPGVFLVAHAVFFGPIVILAYFAWPRICRVAASLGPGVTLCLGLMMVLALGSETRRIANFFPMLVVLTVLAVGVEAWSWRAVVAFGVLGAVTSKFWLHIGPILTDPTALARLFMNLGPWMTLEDYLLHLGGSLIAAALMAAWWQARRRSAHGAPASTAPRGVPAV